VDVQGEYVGWWEVQCFLLPTRRDRGGQEIARSGTAGKKKRRSGELRSGRLRSGRLRSLCVSPPKGCREPWRSLEALPIEHYGDRVGFDLDSASITDSLINVHTEKPHETFCLDRSQCRRLVCLNVSLCC
jgi:hypothetical protein